MLYQRYFLRMNQSNTTHILSLLLALIISLAVVHIIFIPLNSNTNNPFPMVEQQSQRNGSGLMERQLQPNPQQQNHQIYHNEIYNETSILDTGQRNSSNISIFEMKNSTPQIDSNGPETKDIINLLTTAETFDGLQLPQQQQLQLDQFPSHLHRIEHYNVVGTTYLAETSVKLDRQKRRKRRRRAHNMKLHRNNYLSRHKRNPFQR